LGVLGVSTLLTFASLAGLLSTTVGQTALLDRLERTATAFGQPVDDALYARLQDFSAQGLMYSIGVAAMIGPVLAMLMTAIILLLLHLIGCRPPRVATVLSIVSHAGVILALRQLLAAPLNYVGETLASPTTMGRLLVGVDEASPLARFLGLLDVFILWWAILLAIGVATMTNHRVRPMALSFTGVYVAIALLLALAMALTGGTV
jgi:hypothetical protein